MSSLFLKPCPFCNGPGKLLAEPYDAGPLWGVGCVPCGLAFDCTHETPEAAVDRWNLRPLPTSHVVDAFLYAIDFAGAEAWDGGVDMLQHFSHARQMALAAGYQPPDMATYAQQPIPLREA